MCLKIAEKQKLLIMPAASMKPKNVSSDTENLKDIPLKDDTSNKDEYLDPKGISQGIIDKKIRNLVKRRVCLFCLFFIFFSILTPLFSSL